jgi:hypothetical protein
MFSRPNIAVDADTKKQKKKLFWRKARRRTFWAFIIALVAHSSFSVYSSILLNRELATIRAKGDPLRFADLKPPAIPDSRNAFLVYQQASKALHFSTAERIALNTSTRSMTRESEKLAEAALRKNARALELARKAAAMPDCRFPIDWSGNPTRFNFPYSKEIRELCRLLYIQAKSEAKNGNHLAALRDSRAIFGMTHHFSNEPLLIGYAVAQSMNTLAHGALAYAIEDAPLTVTQARAFQASLPRDDWTKSFRHALVGERAMGLYVVEGFGNGNLQDPENPPRWFEWVIYYPLYLFWRPILKLDETHSLRLWSRLIDTPTSQQVPLPLNFVKLQNEAIENTPRLAMLTRVLLPVFTNSSSLRDAAEVRRRQREVALALACYRTAKGQYPADLEDVREVWGANLPLDPYSQKAFVYQREGKSFRLYSIGLNRKDDGGRNRINMDRKWNSESDDQVWLNSQSWQLGTVVPAESKKTPR